MGTDISKQGKLESYLRGWIAGATSRGETSGETKQYYRGCLDGDKARSAAEREERKRLGMHPFMRVRLMRDGKVVE